VVQGAVSSSAGHHKAEVYDVVHGGISLWSFYLTLVFFFFLFLFFFFFTQFNKPSLQGQKNTTNRPKTAREENQKEKEQTQAWARTVDHPARNQTLCEHCRSMDIEVVVRTMELPFGLAQHHLSKNPIPTPDTLKLIVSVGGALYFSLAMNLLSFV
jgi:hypothetical protein